MYWARIYDSSHLIFALCSSCAACYFPVSVVAIRAKKIYLHFFASVLSGFNSLTHNNNNRTEYITLSHSRYSIDWLGVKDKPIKKNHTNTRYSNDEDPSGRNECMLHFCQLRQNVYINRPIFCKTRKYDTKQETVWWGRESKTTAKLIKIKPFLYLFAASRPIDDRNNTSVGIKTDAASGGMQIGKMAKFSQTFFSVYIDRSLYPPISFARILF